MEKVNICVVYAKIEFLWLLNLVHWLKPVIGGSDFVTTHSGIGGATAVSCGMYTYIYIYRVAIVQ